MLIREFRVHTTKKVVYKNKQKRAVSGSVLSVGALEGNWTNSEKESGESRQNMSGVTGQVISEWNFGVWNFQKKTSKNVEEFLRDNLKKGSNKKMFILISASLNLRLFNIIKYVHFFDYTAFWAEFFFDGFWKLHSEIKWPLHK